MKRLGKIFKKFVRWGGYGIYLLLCLMVFEWIAGKLPINRYYGSGRRYVVLREHYANNHSFKRVETEVLDRVDGLESTEFVFRTDKNGYIKPSDVYPDPDLKIYFLGGSTTECKFVSEEKRFPNLVGEQLSEICHLNVNSYNSGVSGNNSFHSITILRNKILFEDPDIVVLMHNCNDIAVLNHHKTYGRFKILTTVPAFQPLLDLVATKSNLIALFRQAFNKIYNGIASWYDQRKSKAEKRDTKTIKREETGDFTRNPSKFIIEPFRKNLELFIFLCRQHNIIPVLMTQQNRPNVSKEEDWLTDLYDDSNAYWMTYRQMNQTIRDVAEAHHVLLIDLDKNVPKVQKYIYDSIHFNDDGSELAAAIITKQLRDVVKKRASML